MTLNRIFHLLFCAILGFALSGCGNSSKGDLKFKEITPPTVNTPSGETDPQAPAQKIDYALIRERVLRPQCLRCHEAKKQPLLNTYEDVKNHLSEIEKSVLQEHTMPPKKILADDLQQLLRAWIKSGAPETINDVPDPTPVTVVAKLPPLSREQIGCAKLPESTLKKVWKLLGHDQARSKSWQNVVDDVKKAKARCLDKQIPAGYQACFANVEKMANHEMQTHRDGHSMQFLLSDQEYIQRQPPEMLAFPDELKNGLPNNWQQLCQDKGWDCLKFVSGSLPNPPRQSFWRLIVHVKGELFDRWMLFTLPSNGKGTAERLIDFMAVETHRLKDGERRKLQRPLLHFTEYWRDNDGTKPVLRDNIASCYKCHPNGMRDITPAVGSVDEAGLELSKKLNQQMRSYGDFDWGESIDIKAFGPPMGERQGCIQCHNGKDRGAINAGHLGERSRHQLYFKMIQDISMPPQMQEQDQYSALYRLLPLAYQLNNDERLELYRSERLETLLQHIPLGLGADQGPSAESKKDVLDYLKDRKLISKSEHRQAVDQLDQVQDRMKKQYKEMMDDYEVRLNTWLKGDRQECLGLF